MLGLALVVVGHSQSAPWLPLVVTLAAALAWAIGNVLARRAQASSGLSLVAWSGIVVPLSAFALSLVVDSPPVVGRALSSLSWVAILTTVYTAVFASLIGYGIWNSLLARYPTSAVVPLMLLVPATTEFIGGAIMFAGLAAAALQLRRRADPTTSK